MRVTKESDVNSGPHNRKQKKKQSREESFKINCEVAENLIKGF